MGVARATGGQQVRLWTQQVRKAVESLARSIGFGQHARDPAQKGGRGEPRINEVAALPWLLLQGAVEALGMGGGVGVLEGVEAGGVGGGGADVGPVGEGGAGLD